MAARCLKCMAAVRQVSACVASRVSARRPRYFSLLRQRKVPKRKATPTVCVPALRCGQPAVLAPGGDRANSPAAQTCTSLFPPGAALLGTAKRAQAGSGSDFPSCQDDSPPEKAPSDRAEQCSRARKKKDACLSEASLRPSRAARAAQVAPQRSAGVTGSGGRLSLLTFFGEAKKVRRPPGRDPACHERPYLPTAPTAAMGVFHP